MMEEEMNVSTESVDTLFFKQAEGREVEWVAHSGTHPLPTRGLIILPAHL